MRIKIFNVGDRVKRSDELLSYSANKHWIGKRGTVIENLPGSYDLVKWDHLEKPIQEPTEFIELTILN